VHQRAGLIPGLLLGFAAARADVPGPPAAPLPPVEPITEVSVTAPEPRYVAPTRRDRIGRIWAPVFINGKGPFRLVLDTGANHSAITAQVAQVLDVSAEDQSTVLLRGVTGSAQVPAIRVNTLIIGDLELSPAIMPIVPDVFGGAEGVLGTEGMLDKRVFIDFLHDLITISRSHGRRADQGYVTIPVQLTRDKLLIIPAHVGGLKVKAIIDTGGQATVANPALIEALARRKSQYQPTPEQIQGATDDIQDAENMLMPPIELGGVEFLRTRVAVAELKIFETWNLTHEPAIVIGMDALGTLDMLVIDYQRRELQIRVHPLGF
jgi:predicted aspartyl protease